MNDRPVGEADWVDTKGHRWAAVMAGGDVRRLPLGDLEPAIVEYNTEAEKLEKAIGAHTGLLRVRVERVRPATCPEWEAYDHWAGRVRWSLADFRIVGTVSIEGRQAKLRDVVSRELVSDTHLAMQRHIAERLVRSLANFIAHPPEETTES